MSGKILFGILLVVGSFLVGVGLTGLAIEDRLENGIPMVIKDKVYRCEVKQ